MKSFYSCLDSFIIAPQSEQHNLIKIMAEQEKGKIVFYGSEDFFVAKTQPFILFKLKRTSNINGVIFFTLNQFCYGEIFNLSLINAILNLKISIHFAREKFSIYSQFDLENKYIDLISYFQSTFKKEIKNF